MQHSREGIRKEKRDLKHYAGYLLARPSPIALHGSSPKGGPWDSCVLEPVQSWKSILPSSLVLKARVDGDVEDEEDDNENVDTDLSLLTNDNEDE